MSAIELGLLPFYWRVADQPAGPADPVPERLPFTFEWDETLGLLRQQSQPEVLAALKQVYALDENVGYLQEGHALAEAYGADFMGVLLEALPHRSRVLEVGCGGGYILRRLAAMGHSVAGVDPSPVARRAGADAGFPVTPAFYSEALALDPQNLIFHYDVLEHTEDPVAFLRAHHAHLAEGGLVVAAVPDCTRNLDAGDPSMVLHEHLNYFDSQSLGATFTAAGFEPVSITHSTHGGVLYCVARAGATDTEISKAPAARFEDFARKLKTALGKVAEFIDEGPGEVGIYVPLRALPYLAKATIDSARLRFFDDDPGLRGRYLPGCSKAVENLEDLAANPPARVLVASFSFGEVIAGRLRERAPGCEVRTLPELLS